MRIYKCKKRTAVAGCFGFIVGFAPIRVRAGQTPPDREDSCAVGSRKWWSRGESNP